MTREAAVGLVLDERFEHHDTGPGHPERPERLATLRERLERDGLAARCRRVEPRAATDEQLARVHAPDYPARIAAACAVGATYVDSTDCAIGARSETLARDAAGAAVRLAREVLDGSLARGFAAMRPPGHHAERELAMGFCLYNSVAVAAAALRAAGVERVLIADWDVHHGNGTQHLFETDPDVFFFSCHQWPFYPGTGGEDETGRGAGVGATLNVPLPAGTGDAGFLGALRERLVPAADAFRPQFVLVSAGFDPHRDDPLGGMEVTTEAFGEATRILLGIAERHADGRLVSLLEGGYDLEATASSAALHLQTLLEA